MKKHQCPECGMPHNILHGNKVKCPCGCTSEITPPTEESLGRDWMQAEKALLREQIAEIEREFRKQVEPYVRRLSDLEARSQSVVTVRLEDIDEATLAAIRNKEHIK